MCLGLWVFDRWANRVRRGQGGWVLRLGSGFVGAFPPWKESVRTKEIEEYDENP